MTAVAGMFGDDEQAVKIKLKELQEKLSKIKGFPIVAAIQWEVEMPESARRSGDEGVEKESEGLDISGGIGGLLGGIAKKAAKKKAAESAKEKAAAGQVLFDFYSEVRRIDVSSIPSSDFEVPPGYKLMK
jgi:hypothetical protein